MRKAIPRFLAVALLLSLPLLAGTLPTLWFAPFFAVSLAIAAIAIARGSPRAGNATLLLVSLAVALTALDLCARALGLGPPTLVQRWPAMPLVNRFVPGVDRDICFADLAAMSGRSTRDAPCVRIVTDASGFRNSPAARQGPLDVIVLGDSFGSGAVPEEETIRAFLERDHALRAHDLSTPASSPWHEYLNFQLEQPRLATRPGTGLAWLMSAGNDLDEDYGPLDLERLRWRSKPLQWLDGARAWRGGSPLRHALEIRARNHDVDARTFLDGKALLFYKPYAVRAARDEPALLRHPNLPALRATIQRLVEVARARGMRPMIFILPTKEEVYAWALDGAAPWTSDARPSGFAKVVLGLCAERRISCFDLKAPMIAESRRVFAESGQLLYWREDSHPNANGNRFIAARIGTAMSPR